MDDQQPTEEQIRNTMSRQRKRTIVTCAISLMVVTFIPVLRGKGHSPLFTAITFGVTVVVLILALRRGFRSAASAGSYGLMAQRAQRPNESYWRYYARYLSSEPSHHPIYRRLIVSSSIILTIAVGLEVLSLILRTGQYRMPLVMIALGLALLAMGRAEFLPTGMRSEARFLRIFANALLLVAVIGIYGFLLL